MLTSLVRNRPYDSASRLIFSKSRIPLFLSFDLRYASKRALLSEVNSPLYLNAPYRHRIPLAFKTCAMPANIRSTSNHEMMCTVLALNTASTIPTGHLTSFTLMVTGGSTLGSLISFSQARIPSCLSFNSLVCQDRWGSARPK